MKIYRFFAIVVLFGSIFSLQAQDGSPSVYSFFGLGDPGFKGNIESLSMGGIHSYTDSIHYQINTPAALSQIKYVNLSLGFANKFFNAADQNSETWLSSHNISYFSLALPIGKKIGIGFGLAPVNSSGYQIFKKDDLGTYTSKGDGGNTRFFLASAYQINKNLSFGLEYQYYFGYLTHENYWIPSGVFTYTRENNTVNFNGSTFKFSGLFHQKLTKDHYINISANYRLASKLGAEYNRLVRIVTVANGTEQTVTTIEKANETGTIDFPYAADFGIGYGLKHKWYIGTGFEYSDLSGFKNPYYDPSYTSYNQAFGFKLGGTYTPQYNSISKYHKRITYRAGAYFKNTGMNLYGTDITDFGITFGLSLPAIRGISNMNIGIETGQRGKITSHLVKEQYINLHISVSLNDKWFIKRKIN